MRPKNRNKTIKSHVCQRQGDDFLGA